MFNRVPLSLLDHVKRKIRRRPSWGRGIIRKKRIYRKETEEEEEEEEEGEPEVEVAGPSDSCLTQDEESSCDTVGPQPNGHLPHGPSTEEESSNEPPVAAPAEPPDAGEAQKEPAPKEEEPTPKEEGPTAQEAEPESTGKRTEPHCLGGSCEPEADGEQADPGPSIDASRCSSAEVRPQRTEAVSLPQADCVNGNESMDSVDSRSMEGSGEVEPRPARSNGAGREEHEDKKESAATQEQPHQDGSAEQHLDLEGMKLA